MTKSMPGAAGDLAEQQPRHLKCLFQSWHGLRRGRAIE